MFTDKLKFTLPRFCHDLESGADPGSQWGGRPTPKPTKVNIFTMIFLYNSQNSIRDLRPFFRPLFCHSSVVKYTLHLCYSSFYP